MTVTRTVNNFQDPMVSPDGTILSGTEIVFQLVDTKFQPASLLDAISGDYIVGRPIADTTDADGYFSVSLWPNSRGEAPTCYKVTLTGTTFKPFYIKVSEGDGALSLVAARTLYQTVTAQVVSEFEALLNQIQETVGTGGQVNADWTATSGVSQILHKPVLATAATTGAHSDLTGVGTNTHAAIDTALTRLANTSGTNTGDETLTSIKTKLGITTLSGDNTGDETLASIKTKLGITTLSGSNTGDQDLSGLVAKAGSLADIATRQHSDLTGVGTNTHAAIDTALTRLANTSGTNTGDETLTSIKTKLGITTLSGSNTGDQDLSAYVLKTTAVNGHALTGDVTVTKADLSLGNVDNTSDLNKPISTATQTALNAKLDASTAVVNGGSGTVPKLDGSGNFQLPGLMFLGTTSGTRHMVSKSAASDSVYSITNTSSTSPSGVQIVLYQANSAGMFITCGDTGATRFNVLGSGNCQNVNNVYGAISDLKLKENITPAPAYWDDFKRYAFVNYNLKADPDKKKLLGLIAQQVQQVSSSLVEATADLALRPKVAVDGTPILTSDGIPEQETYLTGDHTLSVKYSVIAMQAEIVLQEAQRRIEALEAQFDALAARVTALEPR